MSKYINRATRRRVERRANNVCEYCLIAEADTYFGCQVEHIISRKHGDSSELDNLALACAFCNNYKGSDIATLIPETDELVRFYHPRTMRWRENFRLNRVFIEPLTPIGEATVRILQMNHDDQIAERQVLSRRGLYPSEAALLLIMEH